MRLRFRLTPTNPPLVLLGILGCASAIEPPASDPVPVIQVLLIAEDSLQVAWVEWRVPADSTFGRGVRPVDPALVQVSLILPNDSAVPFAPSPGIAGRFEVLATVGPGATYRLTGTIAGSALTAHTMVPGPLTVHVPARDTVDGTFCTGGIITCDLPYSWSASGAGAYLYLQSQGESGTIAYAGSTRDSIGVMRLVQGTGTERLTVLAVDGNAAAFLTLRTPNSSVHGVFGMFGAATVAQRWIQWP